MSNHMTIKAQCHRDRQYSAKHKQHGPPPGYLRRHAPDVKRMLYRSQLELDTVHSKGRGGDKIRAHNNTTDTGAKILRL